MKNKQSFADKVLTAIIILFFIKVVYMIFSHSYTGATIVGGIIGSLILFFILGALANSYDGLGSNSSGSNSNVLLRSSVFDKVAQKYRDLAKQYEDEKNYMKAAHIHLKLLKDKYEAAATLERGQLYNEAAILYLKHPNKYKAAQCYEKAKSYKQAIKYYDELGETEKVGDLYMELNDEIQGRKCYHVVRSGYEQQSQYVKASLIWKYKLKEPARAQQLLLEGWRDNKDAYNCLNNYFANISDYSKLDQEIINIYQNETTVENEISFLDILKHEFKKDESLEETTKNLAYEIIARRMETDKQLSSELVHFNKNNPLITKDILKFKLSRNQKGK